MQLNVELNQYGCTDSVIREVVVIVILRLILSMEMPVQVKKFTLMIYLLLEIHQYNFWIWSNQVDGIVSNISTLFSNLRYFWLCSITLQVTDYYGCIDDTTITVEIFTLPTPNFEVDNICILTIIINPIKFVLVDNSSIGLSPSNPLELWSFDFGDGLPSLLLNDINSGDSITYMYSNINEYIGDTNIITLTLIDTLGCKNVFFDTIFLHPSPRRVFN